LTDARGKPNLTIFRRSAINFGRLTASVMRRATPAIPPKMYRHFAVVTILLTAGLALFAEGENGDAARALVAREPANARLAGQPQLVRAAPASAWFSPTSEADASDFEFGSPMDDAVASDDGALAPGLEQAQEAGYSEEYLASLGAEERELLLDGLRENGMLSPEIRDDHARSLAAASSRRSGAPDGDD
jgi:hypothetical protein